MSRTSIHVNPELEGEVYYALEEAGFDIEIGKGPMVDFVIDEKEADGVPTDDQTADTPELNVGEPTEEAELGLIFRVHGIDLTDERFAGMFDVGADCAGREYPQNGADHMAHEAANVVYHSLKERFEWADEQVDGVAAGADSHGTDAEETATAKEEAEA